METASRDKAIKELQKGIEDSEAMRDVKEEVKKLREALQRQGEEMVGLRAFEKEAAEKADQVDKLQVELDALKEEHETTLAEVGSLREKCKAMVTQVIPHVCNELIKSEEVGVLIAGCINANRLEERMMVLEEVAAEGKIVLEGRPGYQTDASQLAEAADEALAKAEFPFVCEISANPNASIDELLSLKPRPVSR